MRLEMVAMAPGFARLWLCWSDGVGSLSSWVEVTSHWVQTEHNSQLDLSTQPGWEEWTRRLWKELSEGWKQFFTSVCRCCHFSSFMGYQSISLLLPVHHPGQLHQPVFSPLPGMLKSARCHTFPQCLRYVLWKKWQDPGQASLTTLLIPLLHSSFDTSTHEKSLDRVQIRFTAPAGACLSPWPTLREWWAIWGTYYPVFCPSSLYRGAAVLLDLHPETGQ